MSSLRTAPKDYRCAWCETTIHEGQQYARRSEHNGIHYVANKYHPECEQMKIAENLKGKQ
ncbi:hypothetical protein [Comamonas sp. NoAH]|uniref:hypothetical protein n=1 Tax=Comamonas halotolerans TaxID=3041496 RepID=UPI0024E0F770|nr:hypothetical protein [Comamonas sp. NoAH]